MAEATWRRVLGASLLAAAVLALLLAPSASAARRQVVKVRQESSLGHAVLTNRAGLTLYSLSVERHGHFTCKGGCLKLWRPLTVRKGVKPAGPVRLGTVKRPEGQIQVTYRGRPLYRFKGDRKPGQANGEGFKDVGTWHAATPPRTAQTPPEPSPEPTEPYPYPSPYPTPQPYPAPQPTESQPSPTPAPAPNPSPNPYPYPY
jgi:predicted lipoprotein with Yx(FWY)xxD motif